jgi:bacterioferritin-associated ferredoxin
MLQSGVCASRCGVGHDHHAVPLTFYERKAA